MLAAAEGDQVGAGRHESLQIVARRKFGRRVYDDRKMMLMPYIRELLKRQTAAFSAGLIEQRRSRRPDGALDLIGKSVIVEAHFHKSSTSRSQSVVVIVSMRPMNDD